MRTPKMGLGSGLERKLQVYRNKGEAAPPRVIFRAGLTEFMQLAKDKPYGVIYLYDDTNAKDVNLNFLGHKRERVAYLRSCGVRKRKYITSNASRDYEWHKMAFEYNGKPDYVAIAHAWAGKNRKVVARMVLEYLWKAPSNAESGALREEILAAQQNGKIFDSFLSEFMIGDWKQHLKDDTNAYLNHNLPRLIREAVHRFKKS